MKDQPHKRTTQNVNLVLSGSGALYPAHVGAVCALHDLGFRFKAVSASSGGAVIASAIACKTSLNRLKRLTINYDPWPKLIRHIQLPFKKWGFFSNKKVQELVSKICGNTTFEQTDIPIYIIATQVLPYYKRIILNSKEVPNLTLAEAVQITTAIPILFEPIRLEDKTLIDGTFTDNLPIEPFKEDFKNTIALQIKVKSKESPQGFWEFLKTCLSLIIASQDLSFIPENLTVIPINIYEHISPLKFFMKRKDRKTLFDIGYNSVINFYNLKNKTQQEKSDAIFAPR